MWGAPDRSPALAWSLVTWFHVPGELGDRERQPCALGALGDAALAGAGSRAAPAGRENLTGERQPEARVQAAPHRVGAAGLEPVTKR